jgi:hypothetical protein
VFNKGLKYGCRLQVPIKIDLKDFKTEKVSDQTSAATNNKVNFSFYLPLLKSEQKPLREYIYIQNCYHKKETFITNQFTIDVYLKLVKYELANKFVAFSIQTKFALFVLQFNKIPIL